MSGLINNLMEILDSQSDIYEELLELSNAKKAVIIKNDIDSLKKITEAENSLVGKSQKLEKKRMAIISDISEVLNVNKTNITLSYLADIIKEQDEHESFVQSAKRLKDIVEKMKTANDHNRVLMENALEYIDFSINVMRTSLSLEPATYSSTGEEIVKGKSILDITQ